MDESAAAGPSAVDRRDDAELVRMDERAAAGSACTGGAALHVDDGAAASTFE